MLSSSASVTCTAGTSGKVTINASGTIADYTTEQDENKSASASVTVVEPKPIANDPVVDTKPAQKPSNTTTPKPTTDKPEEKKSSDATLKELIIAEGQLTPEFNANVKEYTITVPNEITSLNITANPNDSKATVSIEGNSDFVVGENKITIKVIAEDGTTNEYYINVTKQRTSLSLATLKITYVDKDGNTKEIELNPSFNPTVLEYNFGEISYLINSLNIEAIANLEGAIIEISGNDNLQAGENKITIKLIMKAETAAEGEEQPEDEVVIYTITFTKEMAPTLWQRIKNWFNGIFGGVGVWYNQNQEKVVLGALAVCIVALIGLSIYIIADYRKYKDVIAKLKNMNEMDKNEIQHEGIEEINTEKDKPKGGRRFLD